MLTAKCKESTEEVSEVLLIIGNACNSTAAPPQVGSLVVSPASTINVKEARGPSGGAECQEDEPS